MRACPIPLAFPGRALPSCPSDRLPRVRAIVFDFDGTLAATNIDFAGIRTALRRFFTERRLWDESLRERYILEMIDGVCERLAAPEADSIRAAALEIVREAEFAACREAAPYPGVPEALAVLQTRAYRLGIFTRNTRECCDLILRRHPLPHSVLLAREDVANVKPHPEHLQLVLVALDCPPEHALVVGDHHTDVETAVRVGARAVGVLTTTGTRERFLEAGATLVLDSAADLPGVLPETPG